MILIVNFKTFLIEVEELLRPQDHTNINKPDFSQPISTAIQVALVVLLRSFGIVATTVIGHSSGEIASA